jgi:predicted transport protein
MGKSGGQSTFEDHLAYTDSVRQQMLLELRKRILARDRRITETVTPGNRIAYSLGKIFVEVKVLRSRLKIHFVDGVFRDPEKRIQAIPKSHEWGALRNRFDIEKPDDVEYAMQLIEAAFKSLKP